MSNDIDIIQHSATTLRYQIPLKRHSKLPKCTYNTLIHHCGCRECKVAAITKLQPFCPLYEITAVRMPDAGIFNVLTMFGLIKVLC